MDNNFRHIISFSVFAFIASGLYSQVIFSADTNVISWGERVTITARMGFEVIDDSLRTDALPNWTDTIPGGWEILSVSGPDTIAPAELDPETWNYVIEKSFVVTSFDSSMVKLTGLDILVLPTRTENSKELIGHADIYDIVWTTKENIKRWLPLMGWILLGLCVVVGMWFGIKKAKGLKRPEKAEKKKDKIEAHITALKSLTELKEREAWKKGAGKTFQVQLSQIIRAYIDDRFKVKSLDKTSSEAVQIIKLLDVSEGDKQGLIAALLTGDQIKFAKFSAASDLHEKSLDSCISFVESTWEESDVVNELASIKEERDELA